MCNFYLFRQSLFTYLFSAVFLFFNLNIFAGKKVKVRILQTTDIHSFIEEGDEAGAGGLLRVATLIKKHRKRLGDDKVLLLDSGDTIQGSISAIATGGEAVVDLVNHLKYDAWVLGNHELDFGVPRLYELLNKTTVPVLAGNFKLIKPYKKEFASWKIYKRNGAKICVIGMQASYLKEWFKGKLFEKYEVESAYDVIEKEMPSIRKEKPDMIILALHHGFLFKDKRGVNEVKQIARRFPEIDLILGGHTHQAHPGRNVFGVYYSQAAYHCSHLGVIDALIDLEKQEVLKIESVLEEASSKIEKDPQAVDVYRKWRQRIKEFSTKSIKRLKEPILSRGTPGKSCATSSLIAQSIIKESAADFAIHGRFSSYDLKGDVTEYDLYKAIPYENFIYVLTVSEDQLLKIMDEQVKYISSRSFNGPEGFEVLHNKEKTKVEQLKLPIKKEFYKLAVNSRVAAGGGGRYLWLKSEIESGRIPVEEIEVNTRKAVSKYLGALEGDFTFKTYLKVED
ncbi:MAG: bifunctional metallophosphatase/5'-nucleotidase [Lentisphaeraceae bacterium]|nr:bifunctional metallophosphatase/5'-nucleotidase [Lentisphaeraceae bacterium]